MKYLVTLSIVTFLWSLAWSQNSNTDLKNLTAPMPSFNNLGNESFGESDKTNAFFYTTKPQVNHYKNGDICETIIGTSTYDLQTNFSVANRMLYSSEQMSAVWTFSDENSTSYSDRGSGYNYNDGSSWGNLPTERIESVRIGWPNVCVTGGGKEFVISHTFLATGGLHLTSRDAQGTGVWTESTMEGTVAQVWPRVTTGGADNNSIHIICISMPTANGGALFNGMDGALLYFRSQDQGATWDQVEVQIPGTTIDDFNGFSADSYAISANGDKVAIAVFGDLHDTIVLISEDNGDTWTKEIINDFPVDNYVIDDGIDLDNDGLADTLNSSDGSGTVLVDYNGLTQVFYGNMRYLDDDLGDGNFSYFPFTSGIWHWKEEDSEPTLIVDEIDLDGDPDNLDYVDLGLYFVSITGFVNAASDPMGNTYLAFSSLMEGIDNGAQNYRHIYLMSTSDGETWQGPADMTPDFDGDETIECVFPTMAPFVDNRVQLWYQRDFEPGLAVRGDQDPIGLNDIVHLDIDASAVVSVPEQILDVELDIFPIPSQGELTIKTDLSEHPFLNLSIVDINGKRVFKDQINTQIYSLDFSDKRAGVYFLIFEHEGEIRSEKIIIE